jgi:hypothetical protein
VSAFRGRSRRAAVTDTPSPLDGLLQDMRDLRLTLAADLHAAAAAAEDGAAEVARDIVSADLDEVARFRRVAEMRLFRLQRPVVAEREAPRWRRRAVVALPAVPLVGAMAISAAAVTGLLPLPGHHANPKPRAVPASSSPVSTSFAQLEKVVDSSQSSARDVIAAARVLHRELAALIASSSNDPTQAAALAELLRAEQSLLMSAQPPGASVVLDATRRLAEQLVQNAPKLPKPSPTSTDLPKPLPSSSPTKAKTSPSPSPSKSTTPKPSSSSSPAPSSQSSGQIPAVP